MAIDAYDVPIVPLESADATTPAFEIAQVIFTPPTPPPPYQQKFNQGQDVP